MNGTNYPLQYGYNAASQMTSLTYPSGRIVNPGYDTVGRLSTVKSGATQYLSVDPSAGYNGAGEVMHLVFGKGVK